MGKRRFTPTIRYDFSNATTDRLDRLEKRRQACHDRVDNVEKISPQTYSNWVENFVDKPTSVVIQSNNTVEGDMVGGDIITIEQDDSCERAWAGLIYWFWCLPWNLPEYIRSFNRRYLKRKLW